MDDDERRQRAGSFGSQAEGYARHRPAPPAAAAAWAVDAGEGLVVDLAAGTGGLTGTLASLGRPVVAIDLDPRMLGVLGARLPGIPRAAARGEAVPLRTGAASTVCISSAWHWLDHDRAWPEMARVLRTGGALALIGSGPDRTVPWVGDILGHRPLAGGEPRREDGASATWWDRRHAVEVPADVPFGPVEEQVFADVVPYRVADLPGLAASYSRIIVLPDGERRAAVEGVRAATATHPELAGRETVDLPLRCRVQRVIRTG